MDKKKKGLIIGAAVLTAGAIIATPIIVIKNNKTKGKNNVNENFVLKINEYKEKIKIFTKINSQNEVIELNSEIKSAEDATRKGNLTKEEADLHLQKIEDAYNKALVALDNFNIKTKKDELSKKIQEITTNLEQFINPNLVLIKEQVKKALTHAQTIANNNTSSLEDLDKELKNLAEVFDSNKALYDESNKSMEDAKQLSAELDKDPTLKNSADGQNFQNAYDKFIALGSQTTSDIEEFKTAKKTLDELAKTINEKIKASKPNKPADPALNEAIEKLQAKINEINNKLNDFINPNLVLIKEQVKKALTHAQTIANNNTSSLEDLDKELKNLAEVFDSNKALYDESNKSMEDAKQLSAELDKDPTLKNSADGQNFQNAYDKLNALGSQTTSDIDEFKTAKKTLDELAKTINEKIKASNPNKPAEPALNEAKEKLQAKINEINNKLNDFANPNLVLIKEQVKKALANAQSLVDNSASTIDEVNAEIIALNNTFDTNEKLYKDIDANLGLHDQVVESLKLFPSLVNDKNEHSNLIAKVKKIGADTSANVDDLTKAWNDLKEHAKIINNKMAPFIDASKILAERIEAVKVEIEELYDHSVDPKKLKFAPYGSAITMIKTEISKLEKRLQTNLEVKQETIDKFNQTVERSLLNAAKATWTYFENFYNPNNKRLPFTGAFDEKYQNDPKYIAWKNAFIANYNDFLANKDAYVNSNKNYKELNAKIETYINNANEILENPEFKMLIDNFKNVEKISKEIHVMSEDFLVVIGRAYTIYPDLNNEQFYKDFLELNSDIPAKSLSPNVTSAELEEMKKQLESGYKTWLAEYKKYEENNKSVKYNFLFNQSMIILDDNQYKTIENESQKAVKRSDILYNFKDICLQFRTEIDKISQEWNDTAVIKDNAWYNQKIETLNIQINSIKTEFDSIIKKINRNYETMLNVYNDAITSHELKGVFEQFNNQIEVVKNAKQTFEWETEDSLKLGEINQYVIANAQFYNVFYPIYQEFNIFKVFATRIPHALYQFKNSKTSADFSLNDVTINDIDIMLPKTYGKGLGKKNIPTEITIDVAGAQLVKDIANNTAKITKIVLKYKSYTREIETQSITSFKS